ncbi:MAG: hypothetical protein ACOVJ8_08645 [Sediminibacterium sp.]|jgi:hypothetical protein
MKKFILSIVAIFGIVILLQAQSIDNSSNPKASIIFFELGGPGLASVNFDMRFKNTGQGLGFRAGIGGFPAYDVNILTLPFGLNYIASKDNKNFFEFGAGFTVVSLNEEGDGMFNGSFGHTTLGYRLQPKDGGFTFRATMNPVFVKEGFFPFYAGVGFGWKF